ncbi:cytochrome d ubiquinol oxidase subunit I [Kribbella sp. VKM Ac-2571]|uniref:cytochrome ubiquinol oxidase subunit I n=1 Tax=Kribbella sp. VKM Ac-2571 TaxID=2512222 RepID=UPI0010608982|nr:cytochrome ubiquinol oxidase subunit I [Kribbella sp. VKM Ac-2571]TDO48324.1 cytochrome d ubiquinol oxidase subunit I [Kribbella sp. VKM Ac-2571]
MDAIDLARWQFGITTVYHFLFVPITIGLSALVAGLHTAWYRTGKQKYRQLTQFWGKLFLINFAIGVVTGIVQEFQFGMNWSDYSKFVGDIFGAPLAIEGLLAFFLESTFLGLWIFGWDRLPKKVHLASIWLVAIGTQLSAYFILAANSWMQWPVGYTYNQASGRAELHDFGAVLTNKVALATFPHTIAACFLTGGAFMLGIALWHLLRGGKGRTELFRPSVKLGAITVLVAAVAVFVTGDIQGKIMTETQPMKMAAAEALYETSEPAGFSLLTIGSLDGQREVWSVTVPHGLSFLATGTWNGKVQGINDLQQAYEQRFGPGSYKPNIPVTYWTFRLMILFGALSALIALLALWYIRRRDPSPSKWLVRAAIALPLLPLAANSFGWIFTEMGRQPWIVFGLMQTRDGVSPTVGAGSVLASMITFTVLYGVLAVIEVLLLLRFARTVPAEPDPAAPDTDVPDAAFLY